MIYDINGSEIPSVYGISGNALATAYDKNGTPIPIISGDELKISTYNVGQYYIGNAYPIPTEYKEQYSALQTEIFNNISPDICLMQEATSLFCQDGTLADTFLSKWFSIFATTRGSIGFQAHKVASNGLPIEEYSEIPFTNAYGNYLGFETFYITVGGKDIFMVNAHLSTEQSYQDSEILDILNAVSDKEYFIVCGDFNTDITSTSSIDYVHCIKPFIDMGASDANCGNFGIMQTYYATSSPTGTRYPTDHIIVSENIYIKNAYIDTTKLTDNLSDKIDHVPLVAELIIA